MDFPGHFEQIFQQLNYQRVHGQLCDCVIVVGGRNFKAHRAILAASSTHFRALFSVSEGDGSVNVIRLDSEVVTSEAFSALVDMMYTSTLTLGESNVMDVLLAASHLHLNTVVKACKHYLTTRTLPKSLPAERAGPHKEQQQQKLASGASAHLQHSFLLQQLGLSIVSSALGEETEEEVGRAGQGIGSVSESGLANPRDALYPPRRTQKRKQAFSLIRSEVDQSRRRPRLPSSSQGEEMATGEELLSPDSHGKITDEDSKPDVMLIVGDDGGSYGRMVVQEDVQLPSQSDGGRLSRAEPLLLPHKLEYPHDDGLKEGAGGAEAQHMQVVVKSEPISSPEPADETSDVTSQAEGSDQVEAAVEKLELSPDGSEHSFSEPQPSSHLLLSEIKGSAEEGERGEGEERSDGFLSAANFNHGAATNAPLGECTLEREPPRFLFSSDTSSASSLLISPSHNLLPLEAQEHSALRPDALLLRPAHDGIASFSTEHLAMEYHRTGLGVCVPRGSAAGFPPFRRIAPKVPPGGTLVQEGASPSSSGLLSSVGFEQQGGSSNPLPQLTRASADVLSKCKKALSEHNVLVVEGARKYACKICCKTFLTLTDCKKHIRVHTGEKPYACLKCGKRFSQSSHLYKHSKTTCLRWQNTGMSSALL